MLSLSLALVPALLALLLLVAGAALFTLVAFHLVRSKLRTFAPAQRTRLLVHRLNLSRDEARATRIVGFFHPYCNAGGGGERVLWTALACMQRELKSGTAFVIYTGDVGEGDGHASKEEIIAKVEARFGITLSAESLAFVPLARRWLVEDSTWPRFTLLGQSVGSVLLALEGVAGDEGVAPDVWFDTMGYALTYPMIKWLYGIPVGSYTHYPTISTDMLSRVRSRTAGHTNPASVASSVTLSRAKLAYYTLFARAYAWSLAQADTIMVNSTWTAQHVRELLRVEDVRGSTPSRSSAEDVPSGLRRRKLETTQTPTPVTARAPTAPRVQVVYPPCDTAALTAFPCTTAWRIPSPSAPVTIISLAQFRPEKEHSTQLRAFADLVSGSLLPPDFDRTRLRLVLAGSARHAADHARVGALEALARKLGIASQVEFVVNAPYARVCELLRTASVGLHTMVDEHFGITVVEFQAAGLVTLAHASAGPLLDILVPFASPTHGLGPTGFVARPNLDPVAEPEQAEQHAAAFAAQLAHIVALPTAVQDAVRARARESAVARFGVAQFERGWMAAWGALDDGQRAGEGERGW
ncbi:hypothetical protein JCM3770_005832 [Rhodotorula araucariae]